MNRSPRSLVPLALAWSHDGAAYRVTPWPEVSIERRYGDEWIAVDVSADVLAAGSGAANGRAWRAYLEFVPTAVREFVGLFQSSRLAALLVAARCPELAGALTDVPALTNYVVAQATLGKGNRSRWDELNAVFERGGLFAVLEWLGLPASRQAVAILRNVVAADVRPALLQPLRAVLWKPEGVFALAALATIGDRELHDACALAA